MHFIPPMFTNQSAGVSYLYLSTPETTPFSVELSYLTGGLITTLTVSNGNPAVMQISNSLEPAIVITDDDESGIPLNNKGFKLRADKKFYANYRVRTTDGNQAGSLTAKGRVALGKKFRIGHFPTAVSSYSKCNFFGLSALSNNTTIVISGITSGTELANGVIVNGNITVTLNAGQSYVVGCKENDNPSDPNALMGALVSTTKEVVVNCGSWLSSPNTGTGYDIGIDQIVSAEHTGSEYILVRGYGTNTLETPIVVAHQNFTQVFLHGSTTPYTTLNAGEYLVVPGSEYPANGNIYINTSKPVFMYQQLGGSTGNQTGALNFIPPISCQVEKVIDNIPDIRYIGTTQYESGGIFIVAYNGSFIEVFANGTPVTLPAAQPVLGNSNYITYRIDNLNGDIKVASNGPIQVGVVNKDGDAGWGGYFSGFSKEFVPKVTMSTFPDPWTTGSSPCPDTLYIFTKNVSDVFWYLDGAPLVLPNNNDTVLAVTINGTYMAIGKLSSLCEGDSYDTASIMIDHLFEISAQTTFATCNRNDGSIEIAVSGTNDVVEYSLDGINFQNSPLFDSIYAGTYTATVRLSNGCDRAIDVEVKNSAQPAFSSISISPEYCNQSNASVTLNVAGGFPPYTYQANNSPEQLSGVFTGLSAGGYVVVVKDSIGCALADTLLVPHIPGPVLSNLTVISTSCGLENGSVEVLLNGGTSPFLFQMQGFAAQSTSLFSMLPAGGYSITITDAAGCSATGAAEVMGSTAPIIQSVETDSSTCDLPNSKVIVTASGGKQPLEFGGIGIAFQPSNVLDGIAAGDFWVLLQDQDGCKDSLLVEIPAIPPPSLQITTTPTTCGLDNAEIQIVGQGGVGTLMYSLNGSDFLTQTQFSNIPPGHYTISVEDAEGCQRVQSIEIPDSKPLVIDSVEKDLVECRKQNGILTVVASGGSGERLYSIDFGPYQQSNRFHFLAPKEYWLSVKDEAGCADSTLETLQSDCVYVPNVFSPNDDGWNDLFRIFVKDNAIFNIVSYQIFDRWGDLVYEFEDFPTDSAPWWNGRINNEGKSVPAGVYVYSIKLETGDPIQLVFTKDVTVIR